VGADLVDPPLNSSPPAGAVHLRAAPDELERAIDRGAPVHRRQAGEVDAVQYRKVEGNHPGELATGDFVGDLPKSCEVVNVEARLVEPKDDACGQRLCEHLVSVGNGALGQQLFDERHRWVSWRRHGFASRLLMCT
jgi:hypothetical protein